MHDKQRILKIYYITVEEMNNYVMKKVKKEKILYLKFSYIFI